MASTGAMQIGELSRRTGCNIETIRYYERIGVLDVPLRRGRYRSYGEEDVGRLGFVRRARELGFTLDEVRALLELATGGQAACAEVRDVAASHLADVRAKIADLKRMERVLAASVRACEAGADPACPLLQTLRAGIPCG
ncbi:MULTISPECIES: helix-turn-helix domain-containing protein [unclassified Sphingopyxis]|jgi:MerR family mercuric resistance operon transcriptional regulator|uniref:MerR family transcriptional regulator n=1 Tax=unclassified Sphingopyxis TaxID=2614943 RepID=UPI001A586972|nr:MULTISPECIES: helix-turn-helix domain-containing protein [unclassified Sphingopyxis]MBL9065988.1 helix-turn-helix domain-containing protein [Sphingopyxis sp.]